MLNRNMEALIKYAKEEVTRWQTACRDLWYESAAIPKTETELLHAKAEELAMATGKLAEAKAFYTEIKAKSLG